MATEPDHIKTVVQVGILSKECREQSRKRREVTGLRHGPYCKSKIRELSATIVCISILILRRESGFTLTWHDKIPRTRRPRFDKNRQNQPCILLRTTRKPIRLPVKHRCWRQPRSSVVSRRIVMCRLKSFFVA